MFVKPSALRKVLHARCLEDYNMEERREMWPGAKPLEAKHIRRCRLLENREAILEFMPKHAICAELGILHCTFSEEILRRTVPAKLHLVDISDKSIRIAEQKFAREISDGVVQVHHGDSAEAVLTLPKNYLNWIYIDADHGYEAVRRDLEASLSRLKEGGFIALNDYIFFSPSDFMKYGVVEAVNEFCIEHDFEFVFFALQGRMYNDVVLRKRE